MANQYFWQGRVGICTPNLDGVFFFCSVFIDKNMSKLTTRGGRGFYTPLSGLNPFLTDRLEVFS